MTKTTGKTFLSPIIMMCVLFFTFGFVTWLNGTLIPFLKLACQLTSDVQAFFVTFAFYTAYFFLALPSSYILQATGYKKGMALGLLIMALGSLIFIPAAYTRQFPLFLIGLFSQGMGLALIQTAVNPYVSILGPVESAAKRISIMGICNKIAGALSPLVLGAVLLNNAGSIEKNIEQTTDPIQKGILLNELSQKIIPPYIVLAVVLLILAVIIYFSSLPEIKAEEETNPDGTETHKTSIFQFPHLLLGVLCIFVYVGVEVMAGDAIGSYGKAMGLPLDKTRFFTTYTLVSMLAGYVIGIFTIPKYITQQAALKYAAFIGIFFALLAFVTTGYTAIVFISLLGLANAIMWPAIFPLAIYKLGKFTQQGAALLIMGIVGGALVPLLYGTLKDSFHLANQLAFVVCVLPCYLFIWYYAVKGHKI